MMGDRLHGLRIAGIGALFLSLAPFAAAQTPNAGEKRIDNFADLQSILGTYYVLTQDLELSPSDALGRTLEAHQITSAHDNADLSIALETYIALRKNCKMLLGNAVALSIADARSVNADAFDVIPVTSAELDSAWIAAGIRCKAKGAGEKTKLNALQVGIDSITARSQIDGDFLKITPAEGAVFVVVTASYTNTGTGQLLDDVDIFLAPPRNPDGQLYDINSQATLRLQVDNQEQAKYSRISPRITYKRTVAFDVSADEWKRGVGWTIVVRSGDEEAFFFAN